MAGKRVGIVGLGNAGTAGHIPAFKAEGWEVAAIAAAHADKAETIAKENGIEAAYGDYQSLLAHPGLDAIAVATPPSVHRDMVIQALEAGKHVLVEKPFALNAAEGEQMRAKARETGKTAMIAEAFRFAPSRAFAKELVDQGYVGKVQGISILLFLGPRERRDPAAPRQHWRSSNQTGGGFSAGPASTVFDSVIDWFGPIASVAGKVYQAHPGASQPDGSPADADETMTATFELANGAWGSLNASMTTPFGQGCQIDILGSEGALRVSQVGLLPLSTDAVMGGRFEDGTDFKALDIPARLSITGDAGPSIEAYRVYMPLIRRFGESIDGGSASGPNFDDAYALQRITDAVRESSESGRRITL